MSAAVEPVGPAPAGGSLEARVAGERAAALRLARLAAGGAVGGGVALGAAGAVALLGGGRWLAGPAAAPALAWAALAALGAGGALAAGRRVRREGARDAVVRRVERERALRAGALRVALEVGGAGAVGALAAAQLAPALPAAGLALAPAWRRGLTRRAAGAGGALAVAALLFGASAAHWEDGAAALAHPIDAARGTLLPALRWRGAPARVARGRPLQLTLDAPGRRRVEVAWRAAGRGWESRALAPDARGRAVFALGAVDADLALVATDGRARTDTLRIAADDRAFVGAPQLTARYPAYLGLAAGALALADTVRVPEGTTLELAARASAPLASAALDAGGEAHAALLAGDSLVVRWAPAGVRRVALRASARAGGPVDAPDPFVVAVLPDAAPTVSAALRGAYDGATPVAVAVTAGDDHGLAAVRLHVARRGAGGDAAVGAPVALFALGGAPPASAPAWSGTATLDPARLGAEPGGALVVRVEAIDASPRAQRTWSAPLVLGAPSRSAMRGAARASGDSAMAGVAAALAAARDLQQRTGDLARSRALAAPNGSSGASPGGSPASYEAAERARAIAAQQRRLSASVDAARAQAEALERRLRQSGALDPALARQLADARRMLQEALTPELQAKLAQLEQPGGAGASAAQTRQTLEELAEAQRQLRERLERTADVLRRAALEGAMQTLGDEAREVAQAEARAFQRPGESTAGADRTGAGGSEKPEARPNESPAQTAARAAAVRDAIDSLRARLNREQAAAGANGAAQANAHAARSAQTMQRAAAQGAQPGARRAGGTPQSGAEQGAQHGARPGAQPGAQEGGAQASAQQAAGEMRAAADALAKGRAAQIDAWKATLGAELDRAASEVSQLAREQGAVRDAARAGGDPAAQRGAEGAIRDGVEQTARRLAQAGRTSALLSERTRRAVDEARQQVAAAARALERQGGTPPDGGQSSGQQAAGGQQSELQQPGAQPGASPTGSTPGGSRGVGQARGGRPGNAGAGATRAPDAAMADAQDALARAAGALVRDRARVRDASSAAGAEEVLAQFRAAAGQQAALNQQSLALPQPAQQGGAGQRGQGRGGKQGEGAGGDGARRLAQQQREIAERLDRLGGADATGRSDELAAEARALAQQLDRQSATNGPRDPAVTARQQQLYRKLLEAGQTMERDEQDDKGPRQARAGVRVGDGAPADGPQRGRAGAKLAPPTWNELRALSPEERRLVLEYFRRLNAAP